MRLLCVIYPFSTFIRFGTYGAYLLLAVSLALMGWRAFLIGIPIVVFGIFLSAINYFLDIGNGIPYLFALLAVSVLCLLMWRKASSRAVRLSCFVTGMVSQYFFYFDGHYIFLIPMMCLVVWLGYQHIKPGERVRMVSVCIALWFVGFVSCFMLGQAVKVVVAEVVVDDQARVGRRAYISGPIVINEAFIKLTNHLGRTFGEAFGPLLNKEYALDNRCGLCTEGISSFEKLPVMRDLGAFWGMSKLSGSVSNALSISSVLALLLSVLICYFNIRSRGPQSVPNLLFLIVLILVTCLMFTLPDDSPFRKARFVFILIALCWSCLIMALMYSSHRMVLSVGGGFVIVWLLTIGWWGANVMSMDALTRGSELVARSDFDVYMSEDRLIYVKDDCDDADVAPKFLLHIIPADLGDLPEDSLSDGLDDSSFFFSRHKLPLMSLQRLPFIAPRCTASVELPDYDIETIRTGQFTKAGRIWTRSFSPAAVKYADNLAELRRNRRLVIGADFDVYLEEGKLIYSKSPCSNRDIDARIFLHVHPVQEIDLPQERREFGFDNLDFTLSERGLQNEIGCVGAIDLPVYPILKITTGRLDEEGEQIWRKVVNMSVLQVRDNLLEIQSIGLRPAIQSDFDVYLDGNRLFYAKSPCSESDRDARIFLHVYPVQEDDLPYERREIGFDNLDFSLSDNGGGVGDECVAEIQLPNYEISEIVTGQLDEARDRVWEGRISVGN